MIDNAVLGLSLKPKKVMQHTPEMPDTETLALREKRKRKQLLPGQMASGTEEAID